MIRLGLAGFLLSVLFAMPTGLRAQIVNIEDKRQDYDTTGWFGRVDLSANLTEFSSTLFSAAASVRLDRISAASSWLAVAHYRIGQANGSNYINDGYFHLRRSQKVWPAVALEFFGQAQYNEFLALDFRGLLGVGPRWALVKDTPFSAFLGLVYMYGYEELAGENGPLFQDHRLSTSLALRWQPTTWFTLASTSYYQPLLTDFASSRLSSVNSLVFNFNDRFALGTNFSVMYDNRLSGPDDNVPITTYQWLNSLRISF